jgi:hypothetical protein
MSKKHIHYEAAFQDYLRSRGVPYVPVNESQRAIFAGTKVKSFDFLIYSKSGPHWIVDVKGRRFPYISQQGGRHYWENWVGREDLDSLGDWASVFGSEFETCFVFAYCLEGPPDRWPPIHPHYFRDSYYVFYSVRVDDYRRHARVRSSSWQTVSVSRPLFRRIIRPVCFNTAACA